MHSLSAFERGLALGGVFVHFMVDLDTSLVRLHSTAIAPSILYIFLRSAPTLNLFVNGLLQRFIVLSVSCGVAI
jgi:hypothetical protein